MIATLTNALTGPRNFPLSQECAVIVLSRCILAMNRLAVRTIEESAVRREAAAVLEGLRIEIQGKLLEEIERERQILELSWAEIERVASRALPPPRAASKLTHTE